MIIIGGFAVDGLAMVTVAFAFDALALSTVALAIAAVFAATVWVCVRVAGVLLTIRMTGFLLGPLLVTGFWCSEIGLSID